MKNIMETIKNLKWCIPVAFAGIVAVVQAIGEHQDEMRIDDMEHRIEELESKEIES